MNACEWDGGKVEFRELACMYALFVLRHLSCRETVGFVHNSINVSVGFCSHLNHVGAPPYFTEVCGYHGPSYMTMLEDVSSSFQVAVVFTIWFEDARSFS
uniref:Uncharacterized protein n=1 Tax=Opuntia streptacantha TaxID=393608 RepID=A0A7C9EJ01_OPUST